MTAPRRPSEQATIRGAIVVFIAVLVGVALLSRSDGGIFGSAEAGSAGPTSTTTTTAPDETTTTATVPGGTGSTPTSSPAHPAGEVKVIVVNAAGGIPGIGASNTEKVAAGGFATLPVKNAEADSDATGLFFREGYDADAQAVKTALGFGEVPIQPAPAQDLVPEAAEANVIVVLGKDYPTVSGG